MLERPERYEEEDYVGGNEADAVVEAEAAGDVWFLLCQGFMTYLLFLCLICLTT